jgi:hypothetical protein
LLALLACRGSDAAGSRSGTDRTEKTQSRGKTVKPEIVLEVVPATGTANRETIEFYTQRRREEFGRFLFETIRKTTQNKESKKQ